MKPISALLFPFMLAACHNGTTNKNTEAACDSLTANTSDYSEEASESYAFIVDLKPISDIDLWFKPTKDEASTKLGRDLIDLYNSSHIMTAISYDLILQERFDFMHDKVIAAIEASNLVFINDIETREKVESYKNYALASLKEQPERYMQQGTNSITNFDEHISQRYALKNFGNLTEDQYWKEYYSCNRIKDWDSLREKRGDISLADELYQRYKEERDFDARCIYAIELAHAYFADCNYYAAVPILESLMKEKTHSIYLYKVWRIWRNLMQNGIGMSKDSEIPNDRYDEMRLTCAHTVLNHILRNPKDIMAINTFINLSSLPDIYRNGNQYGNKNVMENIMLYPEEYDFPEEEEEKEEECKQV